MAEGWARICSDGFSPAASQRHEPFRPSSVFRFSFLSYFFGFTAEFVRGKSVTVHRESDDNILRIEQNL
jgi:hypothetical protein